MSSHLVNCPARRIIWETGRQVIPRKEVIDDEEIKEDLNQKGLKPTSYHLLPPSQIKEDLNQKGLKLPVRRYPHGVFQIKEDLNQKGLKRGLQVRLVGWQYKSKRT